MLVILHNTPYKGSCTLSVVISFSSLLFYFSTYYRQNVMAFSSRLISSSRLFLIFFRLVDTFCISILLMKVAFIDLKRPFTTIEYGSFLFLLDLLASVF